MGEFYGRVIRRVVCILSSRRGLVMWGECLGRSVGAELK